MKKTTIPYDETGYFSPLLSDYISGSGKLSSFYSYPPRESSFDEAIRECRRYPVDRKLLVERIREQYRAAAIPVDPGSITAGNIQSLLSSDTFTVTTGHQLCLFTGPLYFIYKIVTVINLAAKLKEKYSSLHFIPVYWMATEDHDFEEINHAHIFGKKLEWRQTVRGPAGNIPTATLKEVLDELRQLAGTSDSAKELMQLLERCYLSSNDLAQATRRLVHELFRKYGLLILDGNDPSLKTQFTGMMVEDIFHQSAYKAVTATSKELEAIGYTPQVHSREINHFYLMPGYRERITRRPDGKYEALNSDKIWTEEELGDELEEFPGRFSPNVVMRPVYQQKILPNIAYAGGGAEMAYWLQYRRMFERLGVFYPVLVPRNSVMWIGKEISGKLSGWDLNMNDIFKKTDQLLKEMILKNAGKSLSFTAEKEEAGKFFEKIKAKAAGEDPTLGPSVDAERQKVFNYLDNLEGKILRVEKQRHETLSGRIRKVKEKLFPEDMLQERYDNFVPFYLKYGSGFIETLVKELNPLDFRFTVLAEV